MSILEASDFWDKHSFLDFPDVREVKDVDIRIEREVYYCPVSRGLMKQMQDRARAEVLELGSHERATLSGLDVLELDDGHQALGKGECHPVLQVVRGDAHWAMLLSIDRCFGKAVRASAPESVTTTVSSSRAPPTPGR